MATLKDIRHKRCISQADLSQRAGVAESTICRLERGHQKPTFRTIRKLAAALEVDPSEIEFTPKNE